MRIRQLALLTILAVVVSAAADPDPNVARGVSTGKFGSFDIDTINTFNGNLVVNIPIGRPLPVGPHLSQNLALVYNSKVYDYQHVISENSPGDLPDKRLAVPEDFSTAGFGWLLSPGRLYPPQPITPTTPGRGWFYRAPDGAEHDFTTGVDDPAEAVTSDGSFLRLRRYPATGGVNYREIEFGDGTIHKFNTSGRLSEIRDRVGHTIHFDYSDSMKWVITNRYNGSILRTTTVNFQNRTAPAGYTYAPNFQKVIHSIVLPAFGGNTATYEFAYADTVLPRDGCGDFVASYPSMVPVPLLTEVKLPDGSKYTFSYQTEPGIPCSTGILAEAKLPTMGSIAWTHQPYTLPKGECDDEHGWAVDSPGVAKRILKDARDNIVAEWRYATSIDLNPGSWVPCGAFDGNDMPYGPAPTEVTTTVTTFEMRNGSLTPVGGRTVHYFSGNLFGSPKAAQYGMRIEEYGLPFTRRVSHSGNGNRFLSTERFDASGVLVESKYLTYAGEPPHVGQSALRNSRMQGTLTVANADAGCGTGGCWVDSDQPEANYDGYGHYRKTVTTSNFGPTRTTFTNHLPQVASWLLNTYDSAWVEEAGAASKQLFTFDQNGVLRSRRTLAGAGATAAVITTHPTRDLLEVFCRDGRGFLLSERFFGGDGPGAAVPAGDPCAATPAATEYQIDHTFTFDPSGVPVRHTANYKGMPFFITDQDMDRNTGVVSASRDVSGVQTDYKYDGVGRPTEVRPAGQPWTLNEYTNASATAPANMRVTTRAYGASGAAAPLTDAYFYYDGMGRSIQEKQRIPSDSGSRWSVSQRTYDMFSRETSVSVAEFRDTSAHEPSFVPLRKTVTTYDVLGRPVAVQTPDNETSMAVYTGTGRREVRRTVEVGLVSGPANVTTIETMDAHGRLIEVAEPNGTKTRYGYDLGARLSHVCQDTTNNGLTCGQTRTFSYDNRGYLTSESHPENGTTSYTYDARGHALSRNIGGAASSEANLQFIYDAAERLTEVRTKHPTLSSYRPGKLFAFGPANEGTSLVNRKLGKLISATRFNYHVGELVVKETYDYLDSAGRLTKTTTEITQDGLLMQKLEQGQAYEASGNIGSVTYPTCSGGVPCSSAPWNTSTLTYTNGLLTREGRFANSIGYNASGGVSTVDHFGPVTDTYTPDETGRRPKSITFAGHTACTTPVIQTGSPQDQTVASGQTATLTVTATNANGYQWYASDGTAIAGQTAATYTTPALTATKKYYLRAYTDCAAAQSRIVTVTVNGDCPTLSIASGSPQDQSISAGHAATLTVAAAGATSYQWYEANGTKIVGQTGATYTTPTLQSTSSYYVEAYNSCNVERSRTATVTVVGGCSPVSIASGSPQDQAIASGRAATLTVSAAGATSYQWFESSGTKIVGQTGPTYTTPNLTSSRSYYAEAYNSCSVERSRTVTVTVCTAPSISSGTPQDHSVLPEQTATLTVTASGATAFQWYESSGAPIAGETSSTFTTPPATATKSYYVIASNACSSVQSRTATVTVGSLVAPTGLQAAATGTAAVTISWNASANAHHYVLERRSDGSGFQPLRSVYGIATTDSHVTAGKTYVYRVRAVSATEAVSSAASNADLATTMVFTSLTGVVPGANHLDQLLAAVNAARGANGSAVLTWAAILPADYPVPAANVPIKAQYLLALRSAMNAARSNLGFALLSYTDPLLVGSPYKKVHLTEIQGGVQ